MRGINVIPFIREMELWECFFVWSEDIVPSGCLRDAFETEDKGKSTKNQRKINEKSTKNQRKNNGKSTKNT